MNETFGPHLTLDLSGCEKAKLMDHNFVYHLLNDLPDQVGMTKMTLPYVAEWVDKFAVTPGYSGFVMIAESHISVHTFPDQDYAFVDIFSCREFDIEKAMDLIVSAFGAKRVTTNIVERGLDFPRGTHSIRVTA